MRNPVCLLTLTLVQASSLSWLGLENAAHASRPENASGTEARYVQIKPARVRIQGILICEMGNQNQGQSCPLKLKESSTGRVIQLIEDREAMRLFQSGARNVAVEGTMPDRNTLAVSRAEAL